MQIIRKSPRAIVFSDIIEGQVYTYGNGCHIYMRINGDRSICLNDNTLTPRLDDTLHFGLRILEAELHVNL